MFTNNVQFNKKVNNVKIQELYENVLLKSAEEQV